MPSANRHYIPGYVWHITHRGYKRVLFVTTPSYCQRISLVRFGAPARDAGSIEEECVDRENLKEKASMFSDKKRQKSEWHDAVISIIRDNGESVDHELFYQKSPRVLQLTDRELRPSTGQGPKRTGMARYFTGISIRYGSRRTVVEIRQT